MAGFCTEHSSITSMTMSQPNLLQRAIFLNLAPTVAAKNNNVDKKQYNSDLYYYSK